MVKYASVADKEATKLKFVDNAELWLSKLLKTWKGEELTVVSPFITQPALQIARQALENTGGKMVFLTHLDPFSIALGSLDAVELASLLEEFSNSVSVYDVDNLHAKIILSSKRALVGSANFTGNGLRKNFELGVETASASDLMRLQGLISVWSKRLLSAEELMRAADDAAARFGSVVEAQKELELPAFPSAQGTYYDVVCSLLYVLTKSPKNWENRFLPSCQSERKLNIKELTAPRRRADFLVKLGLVEKRNGLAHCTELGEKVLKKGGNEDLSDLIAKRYPSYAQLLQIAKDHASEMTVQHLKERSHASDSEIETCKRWAVALDVFTPVKGGKKHIKSFRFNSSPSALSWTRFDPVMKLASRNHPSIRNGTTIFTPIR